MNKTLAILGSGHLGQQIANIALADKHYKSVVFFDDISIEKFVNGFKIIGTSDDIESEFVKNTFDELIIGIGYKHIMAKKVFFDRFFKLIPFATIIHSSSWVDKTAIVKEGSVIYPYCCIDSHVIIDNNTILNLGCTIAHDSYIGKHSFLSPRVAIAGFVKMGELCFVGINVTVIDNINIEKMTSLGGASVVIKDITSSGLYVGNPARFLK